MARSKNNNNDVSNRAIVVMLILSILMALVGTWTVITAIDSATVKGSAESHTTGYVAITISPHPEHPINQLIEQRGAESG